MSNRSKPSRPREALAQDLRNAQQAIDEKEYDVALRCALTAKAEAKAATGCESGFAAFLCAVAADMGGNAEVAFGYITEAIALDPLALPFHRSFDIIVAHVRSALIEPTRDAADPAIARLHGLLLNEGKADAECHLALVRHYLATDRSDEAFKLVDALVEVFPTCAEAWAARMSIMQRLGRDDLVRAPVAVPRPSAPAPEPCPNMPAGDA